MDQNLPGTPPVNNQQPFGSAQGKPSGSAPKILVQEPEAEPSGRGGTVLHGAALILAAASPFFVHGALFERTVSSIMLAALTMAGLAFAVSLLVFSKRSWIAPVIAWHVLFFILFFPEKNGLFPIILTAGSFGIVAFGVLRTKQRFLRSFTLDMSGTCSGILNVFVLVLSAYAAFQMLAAVGMFPRYDQFMPQEAFEAYLLDPIEPFVEKMVPWVSLDDSVGDIMGVPRGGVKLPEIPGLSGVPGLSGMIGGLEQSILGSLPIFPKGFSLSMSLKDLVYMKLRDAYEGLSNVMKIAVVGSQVAIIIGLLYGIGKYLAWLIGACADIAFGALRFAKIVRIETEPRPKEFLRI